MSESSSVGSYIPLGSIGSGCLGIDAQGNFYNDILHPPGQGPLMPNSFPVIRAHFGKNEQYMRVLRSADTSTPPENAHTPEFLKANEYKQQVLYPILSCQLKDDKAPVRVAWTYFSPLAPYDHVASVMPCILLGVRVANPTNRPVACSVMFCMDNLTTEPAEDESFRPAQIHFIRVEPTVNDNRSHLGTSLFRGAIAEASPEVLKSYVRNAILFGDRRNTGATALPHLALGAKEQLDAALSQGVWDPESPSSAEFFWKTFREQGHAAAPQPGTVTRAGAVCSAAQIAPGAACRFDFLFAWHVPPKICEEKGVANGYMQHFANAPESLRYGLRHLNYLHAAVSNWQKQLTGSGLPEPFTNALIDSSRSFVTHARHLPKNGFALATRNYDESSPQEHWDFLKAFALLAFMPRFHAAAVTTALATAQEQSRSAAKLRDAAFLRHCAEIILSAYADVLYTGNRTRFREWYPRISGMLDSDIRNILEKGTAQKSDAPLDAATTGLWAVAMAVAGVMAREQGDDSAVQKREPLRRALKETYESRLLDLAQESDPISDRHVSAVAGACYAELLNLNGLGAGPYVYALLPERTDAIAHTGGDAAQRRKALTLAVIAALLFSKRAEGGEDDKKFTALLAALVASKPGAGGAGAVRAIADNNLDLWAVLQAVTGVYYDSLHHALIIRPSALVDMETLLPVFAPVSLGKMDVKIEKGQDLILHLRIALDTPLTVESILLRMPVAMRAVRVASVHDSETLTASQELLPGDGDTRLVLRFRTPLKLTGMLTLRLRETTPQQKT